MKIPSVQSPFWIRVLLRYFIQGLLFMMPIAFTVWIFIYLFSFVEDYVQTKNFWIALSIVIPSIFLFGWLSSTLLARPLFAFFEEVMSHAPLVKFVYTSLKDLTESFMGNKKKFDKPVLVKLDPSEEVWRMGFITREELDDLHLPGMVAVYIPLSYSFSGNLVFLSRANCKALDVPTPDALRFVVSGGVTGIHEKG